MRIWCAYRAEFSSSISSGGGLARLRDHEQAIPGVVATFHTKVR